MDDLINRQSALDALDKHFESFIKRFGYDSYERADEKTKLVCDGLSEAEDVIIGLPSATDKNVGTKLSTNLAEVDTDCISRRSAIDALRAMQTYKLFAGDDMLLIDQAGAQTELMLLPPIQPKTGKWIRDGHHIRCDQCGIYMCDTDREGDRIPTDFCPSCGSYNGGEYEV